MPLFLVERTFADLVPTDDESMAAIKLVNDEIGVQWLFSFLSADKRKTFCLYEAVSPEAIRAAAQRVGIPVDAIIEVSEMGPDAAAIAALRAHPDKSAVHKFLSGPSWSSSLCRRANSVGHGISTAGRASAAAAEKPCNSI